jgi:hypothetical protein
MPTVILDLDGWRREVEINYYCSSIIVEIFPPLNIMCRAEHAPPMDTGGVNIHFHRTIREINGKAIYEAAI